MTASPVDTDLHAVIAALRAERDAALARETKRDGDYVERAAHQGATVEVLQAMAVSPDDPKPVFELIVRRAHDLCNAYTASLARVVDGSIVLGAYVVPDEGDAKGHEASFPRPVAADTMFGRAILAREPVQLPDVAADQTYALREGTLRGAVRAQAAVPLMRDRDAVGAINITRRQTGEFSQAQIELLQVFAAQAVIAITSAETYRALEERTAALAQRNTEYGERIEHQSATIDVLKAMSASPGDPQPVFDLIVDRARDLCDAYGATVFEFDGTEIHWRAATGVSDDPAVRAAYEAQFPMAPTRGWAFGRAILDRRIIRIDDMEAEPGLDPTLRGITAKSNVTTPIMRGDEVIGAIGMGSREKGGFSDSQVELLKTFAEQAVIAITSSETYRALQTRTSDLQQSLEYQTATSDVLKVINQSTFNLQPVLNSVAETTARLCAADQAAIFREEGGSLRLAADFGFPSDYRARWNEQGPAPLDPDRPQVLFRAAAERRTVHIHDAAKVPGYGYATTIGRVRTVLGVPLLREGELVGVIVLARQRVEPFTDRQIELVSTFADQAVIAIENTRLLTEQQEALERQTAMAEVLAVINANPGELGPVFDMILEKAHRLCDIGMGALLTCEAGQLHAVVTRGYSPEAEAHARRLRPIPLNLAARAKSGAVFHVPDVSRADSPLSADDFGRTFIALTGARTYLVVPLSKEGALLGTITAVRREVRPFTERQITLLKNFAAQAVIAMENARLLTEQREALEQQTATAEVLQVINASPGNLAPVFDAMLEKAMRLCEAAIGILFIADGDVVRVAQSRNVPPDFRGYLEREPPRLDAGSLLSRAMREQTVLNVTDLRETAPFRDRVSLSVAAVELGGIRSICWAPLVHQTKALGLFAIFRQEVRAFSDKQIALLENFAAQAVIAMENARLLTEQREALEQQTATAEVLQVINASPGNLRPVFDIILDKAMWLCGAAFGGLSTWDGNYAHMVAMRGYPPALNDKFAARGPSLEISPAIARLYKTKRPIQVPDVRAGEGYRNNHPDPRALADLGGARTFLAVPLRKDEVMLGHIAIYRQEVRPFSDKQIALLENFAAQAVIAMENARLINEQREALEQQTGTAEVLQVINANPGNLAPVFDAILEKAHSLCGVALGELELHEGGKFRAVAMRGVSSPLAELLRQPFTPPPNSPLARLLAGEPVVQIADLFELAQQRPDDRRAQAGAQYGLRTVLFVPLRKDDALLGYITAYRQEVRPFSEKEIALLQNFAAQAVIAMENTRLITEISEALEQQTATAEVLQVINASPGDLMPVFDAILEKAHALCGAATGSLQLYDGEFFRAVATRGLPDEFANILQQPRSGLHDALLRDAPFVQITDIADPVLTGDDKTLAVAHDLAGVRTHLRVPLRKDDALLGLIVAGRREVRPFSQKEILLLQSFAAQAVIAMENARLLNEIRQRQAELRTTFDNMGDGVAMFDTDLRLAAWNRNFQQIIDLPDTILETRPSYADYLRLLAERGEFGTNDIEAELSLRIEDTDKELRLERVRPDGRVIEVRRNAVPGGGFVLIYSDITERKRSEEEIRAARDAAEIALRELRTAQANLIQAEKMASLGQLTAGIAHEIKNPLNFVNNFAALSVDLLSELKETAAPGIATLTEKQRAEVEEISVMLTSNLEKITEHGKRADGIVKAMLEHSRGSSGERRLIDLNTLIDEALNLAYHGARAQDQSFNVTLERDFGEGIAPIEVNPQDITRVLLNIFANGFYAVTRQARSGANAGFVSTLRVTTRDAGKVVEIRVRDNGIGIPANIRDKLFQPFFTTKPTGEGTGLGLSITYDIITQQHGGSIAVDSKVGEYSEFMIRLPREP